LVKSDGSIVLLDFGMVGEISRKDATHFQNLIQAILLKNYAQAAEALKDLGFLLPGANLKIIENLLKDVLSIDLKEMKEMDLFAVKKEMNDMLKLLPIQVPTRFIFLGRSFITIEGLLLTINPNKEILDIIKPAFSDWLKQGNVNNWKFILQWINALPIFKVFHSVQELIETPQRLVAQKETLQQRDFHFSIYENQKKHTLLLGTLGFVGIFFGMYLQYPVLSKVSAGLIVISATVYIMSSWRQRKWLKSMDRNRKRG
ncbi:MAG: AarF/ABC1/UbiB kinase family protein, partial [Lysinibacillus sp.]